MLHESQPEFHSKTAYKEIFEMPPDEANRIIAGGAKPAAANPSPFGIAGPPLATPDPDTPPVPDRHEGAPAAGGDCGAERAQSASLADAAPWPEPGAPKVEWALALAARGVNIVWAHETPYRDRVGRPGHD
jgi:hypothetical protein